MGRLVGICLLLMGIAGYLYDWIGKQKIKQCRLEEVIRFLQKSIFAIEAEKIKIIPYFSEYCSKDEVLNETLKEIVSRLNMHLYPKGEEAWREVFLEKKQDWQMDEEILHILIKTGTGFFGTRKEENICFLQKSIKELELQKEKRKEKDAQERKVWIPVGMLGGIMLTIMLM